MTLFKNKDGNWYTHEAETPDEEQRLRAEGYKPAEELWPTPKKKVKS